MLHGSCEDHALTSFVWVSHTGCNSAGHACAKVRFFHRSRSTSGKLLLMTIAYMYCRRYPECARVTEGVFLRVFD